jgi:FKBP-type peptidyl-prolyl cis-trans isomerase FklB
MRPLDRSAIVPPFCLARCLRAVLAPCALLLLLAGHTVANEAPIPAPSAGDPVDAAGTNAQALKSEMDKLSYALGVNAASQLQKNSVDVDADLYFQGFKAQLSSGNPLVTAAQASATVGAFQTELMKKQKTGKTTATKEKAEKNKRDGEAFLTEHKSKEGVVTLPSGLQYKILKAGDGEKPTLEDTVVCNYRGTLVDGTEFDSTARRGRPGILPVKKVIKGWREALPLMAVGSKWQIVVPPDLAYGMRTAGHTIGPNSTLIFELELIAVKETTDAEPQVTAGTHESTTEITHTKQDNN